MSEDQIVELTAEEANAVNGGDGLFAEFVGFMGGYYAKQVYNWVTAEPIQYDWTQK
jgi:hypothetical protein